MTEAEARLKEEIVLCPKCKTSNNPGVIRCTNCKTCLRPTFLAVVTFLCPIALVLLAIASLAQIEQNPAALLVFFINVAGIVILIGLRYGRYWAWVGIQVLWGINIAFSAIEALVIHPALLIRTAVQTLIIILLWMYIHSERVRAFCYVGRPR